MMDLAKFERVFAKEPKWRPVSNTGRYHLVRWREGDREWWGWQCKLPDFKDDPPLGDDVVDYSCAAALIRDAVAWGLAAMHNTFGVGLCVDGDEYSVVGPVVGGGEINSSDRTEVLYLAACKALGLEPEMGQ